MTKAIIGIILLLLFVNGRAIEDYKLITDLAEQTIFICHFMMFLLGIQMTIAGIDELLFSNKIKKG